ncbi:MAG: hypothetical protein EXQ70_08455 [Solirubrobacterales bacterium]|nr:hypothetical protein [Solirubrobacterales bacterium]
MPLKLIAGPPNSGRTGAVLEAFRTSLHQDPVLVVPNLDDAERFERELCGDLGGVIGGHVGTFAQLFEEVARAVDVSSPPPLSQVQRVRVAREGAGRAELSLLARSARRPGFAPALAELIEELEAAGVDPADLSARAAEAGEYERELASLYHSYAEVRDGLRRGDSHLLARAAIAGLRTHGEAWAGRPVLLYGFDDLTGEQLELLAELSKAAAVTVALTYEDSESLAARARLLAQLRDLGGVEEPRLEAQRYRTTELLFELERSFMQPDAKPLEPGPGLTLLESAGELAEVEAIGSEIALLLKQGVDPGQIAIVLRDPASQGALYRRVLDEMGIPVAVESRLPLRRTATGKGLASLVRAALGDGEAEDLIAYLRTPGLAWPENVDWLERSVRRGRVTDCEAAAEIWREKHPNGPDLRELAQLRDAGGGPALLRGCAHQARRIAELAMRDHRGELPNPDRATELRAGAAAERALADLADLGLGCEPRELIDAIEEVSVPLWRGPAAGRVRVLSPYRVRAGRVDHLFVASLQEGEFPRGPRPAPLLDDDRRAALGLPDRADPELEERYLFAVCLSRPHDGLWLSWRSSDDEGRELVRSSFVDEVCELFGAGEGRRGTPESMLRRRGLAEVVGPIGRAASPDALAASLAALGPERWPETLASLAIPGPVAKALGSRLAEAASKTERRRVKPGPIEQESVLAELRRRDLFSASTLESHASCPYIWFVEKELNPQTLDPSEESQAIGSVVHAVLEKLYAEGVGGERSLTAATLDAWCERAGALSAEVAAQEGIDPADPEYAAQLRRATGLAVRFLEDEAAAGPRLVPEPELAEAKFGMPDAEKEALSLGDFSIRGMIDRVDLTPEGSAVRAALIQDYKSARDVIKGPKKLREDGKLQLQLYLRAIRELWGMELIGGVYRPLGGTSSRQAQGLLRKEMADELDGLPVRKNDLLDDEKFEAALDDAAEHATEIVAAIRGGEVKRDPIGGSCPTWCSFQPICRRERGGADELDDEDAEPAP